MYKKPPKIVEYFLGIFIRKEDRRDVLGDFEEIYNDIIERRGLLYAHVWYWFQVVKSFPAVIFNKFYWNVMMFKNYWKVAFRNMRRQKGYSFINISGLAIGMACAVLILLWVRDELSYDRFHKNADNIYRVIIEWKENSVRSPKTMGLLAPAIIAEIPEIKDAVMLNDRPRAMYKYGDKAFYEDGLFCVDASFFNIFSFTLLEGNLETALEGTVITEDIAKKYFGEEKALGKALNWNNWSDVHVTGVVKNPPRNSHLQFSILNSHEGLERNFPGGYTWGNCIHETYVLLEDGAELEKVTKKIVAVLLKNNPGLAFYVSRLYLQPLTDIHLNADITGSFAVTGDRKYVYIFSVIAFFILFIACVNFMNLSTARSMNRAREVGMRKAAGANRFQLIKQFFGETILLMVIAFIFAIILIELFLPAFNNISGKQLSVDYWNYKSVLAVFTVILMTGLIAGSYPALYLSSFSSVLVLKNSVRTGKRAGNMSIRRTLVIIQFFLSIALVCGTLVISSQLKYIRNMKLGFGKENLVSIPAKDNIMNSYEFVKNELLKDINITGVAAKNSIPTFGVNHYGILLEGQDPSRAFSVEVDAVDYDFIDVMNMEILEGRNFSKEMITDAQGAVIVNEEVVKLMGIESGVGKKVNLGPFKGTIIGVVKNAHFKSLHHKVEPILFHILNKDNSDEMNLFGIIIIRITGKNVQAVLSTIEKVWKQVNPGYPFEYHFLDRMYEELYDNENRTGTIFNYFTVLAIFISCLGLFVLASFTVEQRTKEIGIRKVLGASASGILRLFSKEYVLLITISALIACPVSYFFMSNWLKNFAYRTDISIWIFLLAGIVALAAAVLTVSSQVLKAAWANPAEALRFE